MVRKRWKITLMQAAKIAVGSSVAIYVAELFGLQFASSAGSIALLTVVATKWDTVKLSVYRIVTFLFTILLAYFSFTVFRIEWVEYGVFIFALVMLCEAFGWKSAISVNAVIGTHFLTTRDFSADFIKNEFLLVVIGIVIALLLNMFHGNNSRRREIVKNMRYTEKQLQMIFGEVAEYLTNMQTQKNVWGDLKSLEADLQSFIDDAYSHNNNSFQSHPGYYVDYFEMRLNQCHILHNLHNEMKKIRNLPRQAKLIADYILYLVEYVVERNAPQEQIEKLEGIFEAMKQEPLPVSREEFESRAILYHILMDLEEFLIFKKRFVESLSDDQRKRYWDQK